MATKRCEFSRGATDPLSSIIYHTAVAVELVGGVSLNVFIIAVTAATGLRNRRLRPIEQILIALGVSRFLYLCVFLVKLFYTDLVPWVFEVTQMHQMIQAATWFLTCTTIFFSVCLCTFYCAKIANFQQRPFLLLKRRINQLVPWSLLFSVLASLLNTCPFFYRFYTINCGENGNSSAALGNGTLVEIFGIETNRFSVFVFCSLGFSVAFSCLATLAFLLLFSLWRHTKSCMSSFSRPNLDAHFQAVKVIVSLLTIEAINFVALILLLSSVFEDKSPQNWLCTFIVLVSPTLQSGILIWGNPQLKGVFVAAVFCCSWRLSLS